MQFHRLYIKSLLDTLKCEKCEQILVHLDYFDLNQNFEKFNAIFEDALQNHHFTTQKNDMGGGDR